MTAIAIVLFTDFGSADLYVGQVKAVLERDAPETPVIDLLNDAPAFAVRAAAHLLASLVPHFPQGSADAPREAQLVAAGRRLSHARVFSEAREGVPFWYENSQGLVEIAVNRGSAAREVGLEVGTPVAWAA
jgi:S-adenosylmethionine hydrolase